MTSVHDRPPSGKAPPEPADLTGRRPQIGAWAYFEGEVVERRIDRSELYVADEMFLTGTGAQVAPVASIDDRTIGSGEFPVSLDLQARYYAAVRGRDPRYAAWLTPI